MAKVIKLQNGSTTLLPITDSSYVQYKTVGNQYTSVKDALDQLAGKGHDPGYDDQTLSYTSGTGLQLSHYNGTSDTVTINGSTEIGISGATNSLTINHTGHAVGNVSASGKNVTGTSGQQVAITGLTINETGHVTGYTAANIYSTDTFDTISASASSGIKIADISSTGTTNSDTALYVPTGTTSTTVALGDHTHTSELSVNTADATITYNTGGVGAKTTTVYKASTSAYGFAKYDSTPTAGSQNSVTSDGVYQAIQNLGTALNYKGTIPAGQNAWPTSPSAGDVWYFAGANTISGQDYESGDMAMYNGSTWSVVNANWTAADGSDTLAWGETTTLATIGGVTIDATMPSKPTLSVSKNGTGNFVKQITANDHAITYVLDYAYSKVSQSGTTGVVTAVSGSNDTITVTSTSLETSKVGDAALTYIASISQAANGKITATTGTLNLSTSKDNPVDSVTSNMNFVTLKDGAPELDSTWLTEMGLTGTASTEVVTSTSSTEYLTSASL